MKKKKINLKGCTYLLTIIVLLMGFGFPEKTTSAKTFTIEIIQMQFQPALLKINKGDTVIFLNRDIVAHDATEIDKAWHSPSLATGESWKLEVLKSADYYCSIHLVMKGQIIVD